MFASNLYSLRVCAECGDRKMQLPVGGDDAVIDTVQPSSGAGMSFNHKNHNIRT